LAFNGHALIGGLVHRRVGLFLDRLVVLLQFIARRGGLGALVHVVLVVVVFKITVFIVAVVGGLFLLGLLQCVAGLEALDGLLVISARALVLTLGDQLANL